MIILFQVYILYCESHKCNCGSQLSFLLGCSILGLYSFPQVTITVRNLFYFRRELENPDQDQ